MQILKEETERGGGARKSQERQIGWSGTTKTNLIAVSCVLPHSSTSLVSIPLRIIPPSVTRKKLRFLASREGSTGRYCHNRESQQIEREKKRKRGAARWPFPLCCFLSSFRSFPFSEWPRSKTSHGLVGLYWALTWC